MRATAPTIGKPSRSKIASRSSTILCFAVRTNINGRVAPRYSRFPHCLDPLIPRSLFVNVRVSDFGAPLPISAGRAPGGGVTDGPGRKGYVIQPPSSVVTLGDSAVLTSGHGAAGDFAGLHALPSTDEDLEDAA